MSASILVRTVRLSDASQIAAIYTESILARDSTMDLRPSSMKDAENLISSLKPRETICVCERSGKIVGWGIVKLYSPRPGYLRACETSVYVFRESTGKGAGTEIQRVLIEHARDRDFHHIVAKIWAENTNSRAFHEKLGFTLVGIQKEIGSVDGLWKDIAIMQCIL